MISQVVINNSCPQRRQRRIFPTGVSPSLGGVGAVDHGDEGEDGASGRVRHRSTQIADGGPQEGSPPRRGRPRLVVVD